MTESVSKTIPAAAAGTESLPPLEAAEPTGEPKPSPRTADPAPAPGPTPSTRILPKLPWKGPASSLLLGAAGAALLIGAWQLLALVSPDLPAPLEALSKLRELMASPFHDRGPNDKGVLLQLSTSLGRVFAGFGLAALVGIPIGFLIGASRAARGAINPIVQVLRPVSPLAWFPIALVLLKDAGKASIFTIGITALWPTLVNTAFGVAGVPQDHCDVARVFRFNRRKYVRHVLLPYSMTSIITGLRLSMGIGWMVIVATEMLAGGTGIGFFVWDSYNNNNLAAVVSAILIIGVVGFVLDLAFARLARKFDYAQSAG